MKNSFGLFILLLAIQYFAVAQNKPKVLSKKPLTVKDLNRMEMENIKSISLSSVSKKDSVVKKAMPVEIEEAVKATGKKDTLLKTTIVKEITKPKIVADTLLIQKQKIPKSDTVHRVYTKNEKFADSIRNAHKHWLDSTLAVLPTKKPVVINKDDEIEIYINGGGLYTGVNPTIYNRLTIYNSGLVHKETKTKLQGEKVEDKKITKDDLRKLAQYIIDQGFFEYNYLYDCAPGDKACNARLNMSPEPSALSVTVTVGARRKKIYVALYAPGIESNWVNYPASLEKIVNAIYAIVEK